VGKDQLASKADSVTAISNCLEIVGASTAHNRMVLHCLLQGRIYLPIVFIFIVYLTTLSVSRNTPAVASVSVIMKDVEVRVHVIRMESWKESTKNFS
jgi:hypothetical protein